MSLDRVCLDGYLRRTSNLGDQTRGWLSGEDASVEPSEPALIATLPLKDRIAPALVELALRREITWTEAEHVLAATEHFDEVALRSWRIAYELLAPHEIEPDSRAEREAARISVLDVLAKNRAAVA